MKIKNIKIITVAIFLLLFVTGCINVNSKFKEIRNNVLSNFDNSYKINVEFALGPSTINMASAFVNFDKEAEGQDVGLMLRQVNRIQMGVYERSGNASFEAYQNNNLKNLLEEDDWYRIIINKEFTSVSEIFVKENSEGRLKQMLVVNAETDQMIIMELSGDLDELIAVAVANNGLNMAMKK